MRESAVSSPGEFASGIAAAIARGENPMHDGGRRFG
jgi:hypothetical protein